MFRREWWRTYSAFPASFRRIVLSIDSAFKKGAENDYSAFTVWGETATDYYLLHAWRGRVEFPELKRKAREFSDAWKPSAVLVEDKASGQSLIQELRSDSNLPIIAVKVDSDKITRASAITGMVEAGKVLLLESAGWLDAYLEEMSTFPAAPHDDFVDSTTQALNYMRGDGPINVVAYYKMMAARGSAAQHRDTAPAITRADSVTFIVGTPGEFTVSATGGCRQPSWLKEHPRLRITCGGNPLPKGLTFQPSGDGAAMITGVPATGTAATYAITFTAIDTRGTFAEQPVTLTITEGNPTK